MSHEIDDDAKDALNKTAQGIRHGVSEWGGHDVIR